MTYRLLSKLAGFFAIIVLLGPLPRILAGDCSCPKPKVKISAIHSLTPATRVKVFFGGVEVPPDADPVAMERDQEYALTVTVDAPGGISANAVAVSATSVDITLTFPHCSIEYSRDSGVTWTRGTQTWITAISYGTPFSYNPTSILIRITSGSSDSATSSPAAGDAADPQCTGTVIHYDVPNLKPVQDPPGLSLEIPMGSVFTPDGYRSAGWLLNYGQVSSLFAAPSSLHYNSIAAVGSMVAQYDILNENSEIAEKHYIAPQGALRVRGWISSSGTIVAWAGALETLVEVYDLVCWALFSCTEPTGRVKSAHGPTYPHSFA